MITKTDAFKSFKGSLMPQEEMLEVGHKKQSLFIGIPKEISFQENRVALGPSSVALLVNNGHRVVVERGAGLKAHFSDTDYSEAGAEIADSAKSVYKANLIVKVAPPSSGEIDLMQQNQTLFSALQRSTQSKSYFQKLQEKKINAVAWDFIKDEEDILHVVRSMGEIAGTSSILIASRYLRTTSGGPGILLGGITGVSPTSVVILGAGTVGEYAAKAALGLGASVKVFDDSVFKLRRLQQSVGQRIFTSTFQPKDLIKALKRSDVVIGAIRSDKGRTPCIVSDQMVQAMKEGTIIIDVSIDQGGCFETSRVTDHKKPTFVEHGIIHYCVPNIPSLVARSASMALSNIFAPILLSIAKGSGIDYLIKNNPGVRNGVYIFKGRLTNESIAKQFSIPYKDINLLLSVL